MTDQVRSFGNSEGSNNVPGGLFQEGLIGNLTTDNMRQFQAAVRQYANQAEWFAVGDLSGPATFTFLTTTSFRVQGVSLASLYHVGRRVRATGQSTGTITGTITAVTANSGNTDVTVDWDGSGALVSETLLIELGINSANPSSVPGLIQHDVTFGGDVTVVGSLTSPTGPFGFTSATVLTNGQSVNIASTVKLVIVKGYGGGGGGQASGGAFGVQGNSGGNGGNLTVTGTGVSMTVSGGRGANSKSGIGVDAPNASVVTGATGFWIADGLGMPGGNGAIYGSDGGPGAYAEAYFLNPSFTRLTVTGGNGGVGGSNSVGQGGGGVGGVGRAAVLQFT